MYSNIVLVAKLDITNNQWQYITHHLGWLTHYYYVTGIETFMMQYSLCDAGADEKQTISNSQYKQIVLHKEV